jgi:hypothetical protein
MMRTINFTVLAASAVLLANLSFWLAGPVEACYSALRWASLLAPELVVEQHWMLDSPLMLTGVTLLAYAAIWFGFLYGVQRLLSNSLMWKRRVAT